METTLEFNNVRCGSIEYMKKLGAYTLGFLAGRYEGRADYVRLTELSGAFHINISIKNCVYRFTVTMRDSNDATCDIVFLKGKPYGSYREQAYYDIPQHIISALEWKPE